MLGRVGLVSRVKREISMVPLALAWTRSYLMVRYPFLIASMRALALGPSLRMGYSSPRVKRGGLS